MRLAQVEQPIVGVDDVFILNAYLRSLCNVLSVGNAPVQRQKGFAVSTTNCKSFAITVARALESAKPYDNGGTDNLYTLFNVSENFDILSIRSLTNMAQGLLDELSNLIDGCKAQACTIEQMAKDLM